MLATFKRLLLGLLLIAAASALLLFSDLRSRTGVKEGAWTAKRIARVALLQHASQLVLDQGRDGIIAGLGDRGWTQGDNLQLKLYNAQGDMSVAQTIAKEMVGGGYDLLLTVSTVSLQAVANANRAGKTPQVFGLVSDPYGAGVGISRSNHLDHPSHLAGFGTMQPVVLSFRTAREMNPALATVGVVWNAAEANSEAQVKVARQICAELKITLLESTVDSSAGVSEAANALVARGVEAIWMAGDVTVLSAADSVIGAAKKGHIPAFTVIPPNVKKGALFDVGADYPEVGRLIGQLAGDILNGKNPAAVSIDNVMPEVLAVNQQALAGLNGNWKISPAMLKRAQIVVDDSGVAHTVGATAPVQPARPEVALHPRKWRIEIAVYNETPPAEETLAGMKAAWKQSALVEGRDYEIKLRSAQGDIAAMSGIVDAALTDGADIIVPMCTPALQVAVKKVKKIPLVFALIANPMVVGAGKSYTDHLPNMTGVSVLSPFEEALDLIQQNYPQYRRLGTLYCPAEANSVDLLASLQAACKQRGLTLDSVAVNSSGEITDSALALMSRPIDAVLQLSDNLSSAGFSAIAKAARQSKKPLFALNSTTIPLGAALALGRDYHDGGEAVVKLLERVMAGETPAQMPFVLPPKVVIAASPTNAAATGMTLPPGVLKQVTLLLK